MTTFFSPHIMVLWFKMEWKSFSVDVWSLIFRIWQSGLLNIWNSNIYMGCSFELAGQGWTFGPSFFDERLKKEHIRSLERKRNFFIGNSRNSEPFSGPLFEIPNVLSVGEQPAIDNRLIWTWNFWKSFVNCLKFAWNWLQPAA